MGSKKKIDRPFVPGEAARVWFKNPAERDLERAAEQRAAKRAGLTS